MTAAQALWKLIRQESIALEAQGDEHSVMFSRGVGNRELEVLERALWQTREAYNEFDANRYLLETLSK